MIAQAGAPLLDSGLGAELVEGADQFAGDLRGGGLLDDVALHQVDQLAVAQDGDGRRGGRVPLEVAAGALGGLAVLACKDGDLVVGQVGGVGNGHAHARAHLAGRASADGVDHQQGGAGCGNRRVHVLGGAGFLDSGAGEFLAHGNDHQFWVHVCLRGGKLPHNHSIVKRV